MGLEFFGEEEEQLEKAQSLYSSFAKMETRHKVRFAADRVTLH
jgi:crooked neck